MPLSSPKSNSGDSSPNAVAFHNMHPLLASLSGKCYPETGRTQLGSQKTQSGGNTPKSSRSITMQHVYPMCVSGKGVQAHSKPRNATPILKGGRQPCPWLCNLVSTDVPGPGAAQAALHPRKDVFVLKVAKIGPKGDRRCKMELELVTPKGPEKKPLCRVDTRETQSDPEPPPCCCCNKQKRK